MMNENNNGNTLNLDLDRVQENLFIGSAVGMTDENLPELKERGIKAILNLMMTCRYDPGPDFHFLHKPLPDGEPFPRRDIEEMLGFIEKHVEIGGVLVHCAAGISRSGSIITAWVLRQHPSWSWDDAIERVRRYRHILPHPSIKNSVLDYLEEKEGIRREATAGWDF